MWGPAQKPWATSFFNNIKRIKSAALLLPWNWDFLMLQVWLCYGRMLAILTVSALPLTKYLPSLLPPSFCFFFHGASLQQVITLYHLNFRKRHKSASHSTKRRVFQTHGISLTQVKKMTKKEYIHWERKWQNYYAKGSKRHVEKWKPDSVSRDCLCTASTLVTVA